MAANEQLQLSEAPAHPPTSSPIPGNAVSAGDEDTPLLPGRTRSWLAMRYGNTRKCVSNKAALLILLWSFVVGLCGAMLLNPEMYLRILTSTLSIVAYGVVVVFTCFFPLAGILADIKFGRHKTVVTSLFIVLLTLSLDVAFAAIIFLGELPLAVNVVFGVLGGLLGIMLYVGLIGFTANVVQFGMDQLHDSPGEDNTLFIHWYVWTYYASFFSVQLAWSLGFQFPFNIHFKDEFTDDDFTSCNIIGLCLLALIPVVVVMVLAITLWSDVEGGF